MADISMCADDTCPSRQKCYRFTAKPNDFWQSWGGFDREDQEKCKYFWSNEGQEVGE